VDSFGLLGVGLGGNCDCRCGILYARMYITVIAGVVSYMLLSWEGGGFRGFG